MNVVDEKEEGEIENGDSHPNTDTEIIGECDNHPNTDTEVIGMCYQAA